MSKTSQISAILAVICVIIVVIIVCLHLKKTDSTPNKPSIDESSREPLYEARLQRDADEPPEAEVAQAADGVQEALRSIVKTGYEYINGSKNNESRFDIAVRPMVIAITKSMESMLDNIGKVYFTDQECYALYNRLASVDTQAHSNANILRTLGQKMRDYYAPVTATDVPATAESPLTRMASQIRKLVTNVHNLGRALGAE